MNDEVIDVVNERDEVIGHERRSEVHRRGLRHRAVHVLVFNQDGALFLQKRSLSKDTFPGAWDSSASGHLEVDEDYDAGAVRELREELGVQMPAGLQRQFKIAACAETGQEFVWLHCCHADGPFTLHPEEIDHGDWFKPADVTRWLRTRPEDFAPTFVVIWQELVRRGKTAH